MVKVMKGERTAYIKGEKSTQDKQVDLVFLLVPFSS